jgi:glyoxylase-like metal-dependent hydrolase (beta-lactamase superfamily II)
MFAVPPQPGEGDLVRLLRKPAGAERMELSGWRFIPEKRLWDFDDREAVAAIIDSVLDFDHPSGRTSYESADAMLAYVGAEGLKVDWLLETHAHADHLSAAPYLQEKLGGKLVIGAEIVTVQNVFGRIFNEGSFP